MKLEDFWKHVDKSSDCWLWLGAKSHGYGATEISGRRIQAHRIAWILIRGPIPKGLFVCHHCDNPPCVRPEHLFLGTDVDNTHDMIRKGRARHDNQPKGEEWYLHKLTWNQVREIRAKYIPRIYSTRKLAKEYGVGQRAIWRILNNETWKT